MVDQEQLYVETIDQYTLYSLGTSRSPKETQSFKRAIGNSDKTLLEVY